VDINRSHAAAKDNDREIKIDELTVTHPAAVRQENYRTSEEFLVSMHTLNAR
jgi:hypothetical protein